MTAMTLWSPRTYTVALLLVLGIAAPPSAAAGVRARCTQGCEATSAEQAIDLVLRSSAARDVTITWESDDDPSRFGGPVGLYAGNPAVGDVPDRGTLAFEKDGNVWRSSRDFRADELGSGTFLAVAVLRHPKKGEQVLDWRAFRLELTAERNASRKAPPFDSALSVDVKPALLTASTGHGDLPPRRGGDLVWWAFGPHEGNTGDLDLDGRNSGIAGLGVQVANPWHTRAGDDWKERVRQVVTGDPERTERFEEFEWKEEPDRELKVEGVTVALRNYYTVVTLYTAASSQRFSERDAGGHNPFIDPSYFSHETTAKLDPPFNPQFWASYDERVHSSDPRLLGLLRAYAREGREVPGLGKLQTSDGDGGRARYTVGLYVKVKPWESPESAARFRAGVVAMDLVAARVGVGGTVGLKGEERSAFCRVIGCGGVGGKSINLYAPPSGYSLRGSPFAQLGTISGALRLSTDGPVTAPRLIAAGYTERDVEAIAARGAVPDLPDEVRFGLAADLRAGLLTRNARWGKVAEVYPINTYAQYVVRITVAMLPDTTVVVSPSPIFPTKTELAGVFVIVRTWLDRVRDFFALSPILAMIATIATALVLLMIASIFFPGLRPLVASIFKLAKVTVDLLARALSWLAERVGLRRKPSGTPGPGPA